MLHILLTILKILGILLLVLVGILLFIILSVLFVPVCYTAQGKKTENELYGKATVSWLFRLLYARVVYREGKAAFEIFVLGIPLLELKKRRDKRKEERRAGQAEHIKKDAQIKPEEKKAEEEPKEQKAEEKPEKIPEKEPKEEPEDVRYEAPKQIQEKAEKRSPGIKHKIMNLWNGVKGFFRKILGIPARVLERIRKIRLTFRGICDRIKQWYTFLQLEDTKQAVRFLKGKGKLLLRHIMPRKASGKIVFGFDDPSLTGKVLAGASVIYPLYKDKLQITPVFERAVLEGEVNLKGRIFGGYLLLQVWQIYRNREVKVTYRRFQHKEA